VTVIPRSARGPLTPPSPILPAHDLARFTCGYDALDDWLRFHARNNEGRSSRTYVVCAGSSVVGYYCLATGAEKRVAMPRKIRHGIPDPTPIMIIGRLAVDKAYQGQGIGAGLLADALKRASHASRIVGCRAVLVHAIDAPAVGFYVRYGFVEFPSGSQTLFLPIETIQNGVS
jgi:GNAT superfamily N-acetyltransferase